MLIIEIALGIVLGWLIINHSDELIETILTVIGFVISVIFYPFKLVANIVVNTVAFLRQHFELIVKGLAVVVLVFVAILCVIGLVEMGYEAIPQYWKDKAPTVVVVGAIIAGALIALKDACVFVYEKFSKNKNSES